MIRICDKCHEFEYGEAIFCKKCGCKLEGSDISETFEEGLTCCYSMGFLDGTGLLKKILKTIKNKEGDKSKDYLMLKEGTDKLRKGMINQWKK